MSTVLNNSPLREAMSLLQGTKGPVTASRHRRNFFVYAILCALALLPTYLGASAAWRAAGLGLFMPGAGFLAVGGWSVLLFPLTVAVFWVSLVAWFWAGMVIAPLTVWLGTAALAALMIGEVIWAPAMFLAPAAAAATYGFFRYRNQKRIAKDREHFKFRQSFFSESLAEVRQKVLLEPVPGERELTPDQLMSVRYLLDLAMQPVGQYKGYTIIDQFQPAALRYQINHLGFGLGLVQAHYTPSFHGYLKDAQISAIETYRERKVWGYWVYESMWGHFNFTQFDPARKDNIMLTGWYGMQVSQYMLNTGDMRYAEPGSLSFKLNERTVYVHDIHSVTKSVIDNFGTSDFCLFPCEPNWVYPVCNMYGLSAVAGYDAVFGKRHAAAVLPKWLQMLNTEFTDQKGSLIGLRSYWTGLEIPFYAGEAGFAFFANVFSPELAQKLWAVGRKELGMCMVKDDQGLDRLTFPREVLSFLDTIDAGNYRPGKLFAYAAVMIAAREFGDDALADAARRSMDQDCGLNIKNGVASYSKASGLANIWAVEGKLMRTGDFRNSFVRGLPESVKNGPILNKVRYPDVLVAKAYSRGADLELVLYPGAQEGSQTLEFDRLKPGVRYSVEGGGPTQHILADMAGKASVSVDLRGRTAVHLTPLN